MKRSVLVGAVALGLMAGGARIASAYPQWQFVGGSRCVQCHFNPAGGGLITGYGRDAVGDELSTWSGDGAFLHGGVELPNWLALSADLRGASLYHDAANPDGPTQAAFPMQADAHFRAGTSLIAFSGTVGIRGRVRADTEPSLGTGNSRPTAFSRFVSREHYLMWRPPKFAGYIRLGRFFAPYGLRLAEHTAYIRRDLGYNLLDETYNFSVGAVRPEWEVHVTGFVPFAPQGFGGRELGGAGLYERRFLGFTALGLSARYGSTEDSKRWAAGLYGKVYVERLRTMLMLEGDVVKAGPSAGPTTDQFVGYGGVTIFPFKGLWLGAYVERTQTDIKVRGTTTDALNGQINWFPYPHFELVLLARRQQPNGQEPARTMMLQLHYFM